MDGEPKESNDEKAASPTANENTDSSNTDAETKAAAAATAAAAVVASASSGANRTLEEKLFSKSEVPSSPDGALRCEVPIRPLCRIRSLSSREGS